MPRVVEKINAARESGLDIRADQYPYVAGGTALASSLPPWMADGGASKFLERLRDPKIRERIKREMATDHQDWENLYLDSGGSSGVLIAGVTNPAFKKYDGKTVAQLAKAEQKPELDALFDFILADMAQTGALYFIAGESDLRHGLKQPWTSPATIIDRATYTDPTRLSEGVDYVLVNGQLEYDHGKLADAKTGRVLRGPGWQGAVN